MWWFISAYILLIIFSPLLNRFLRMLTKKGFALYLGIFWILWYSFAYITKATYYSLQLAIFFYSIGAFIRSYCHKIDDKIRKKLSAFLVVVTWLIGTWMFYMNNAIGVGSPTALKIVNKLCFLGRTLVITPLCAILLFRFFKSIELKRNKVINLISSTTLGVYLIHDSLIVRKILWDSVLNVDYLFCSSIFFPIIAVVYIFIIFIVCFCIDILRQIFLEPYIIECISNKFERIRKICFKDERA